MLKSFYKLKNITGVIKQHLQNYIYVFDKEDQLKTGQSLKKSIVIRNKHEKIDTEDMKLS